MHELAITESLLQVVLRRARESGAERVVGVSIRIGEPSDLMDDWVQRYFDHLSRDTIAAGAVIRIERTPATFRCGACKEVFPADLRSREAIRCPRCASGEAVLVSGRGCLVQQIEVV